MVSNIERYRSTQQQGRLLSVGALLTTPVASRHEAAQSAPAEVIGKVSRRERQVLDLLVAACSNDEIAERLALSTKTVEFYITRMLRRTGARSRAAGDLLAGAGWLGYISFKFQVSSFKFGDMRTDSSIGSL